MTPGNMFFQGKSLWDAQKVPAGLWGTIMEAFQPAPKFEALLDEAMTSIPGQYITVHVRIEEDANKYCQEEEESHVEWKGRRYADNILLS